MMAKTTGSEQTFLLNVLRLQWPRKEKRTGPVTGSWTAQGCDKQATVAPVVLVLKERHGNTSRNRGWCVAEDQWLCPCGLICVCVIVYTKWHWWQHQCLSKNVNFKLKIFTPAKQTRHITIKNICNKFLHHFGCFPIDRQLHTVICLIRKLFLKQLPCNQD